MKQDEISRLLPAVFQRAVMPGTPLAALLAVMEELHAPVEGLLADLDAYFDPRRAPEPFLPFLARWVGLGRLLDDWPRRADDADFWPSGSGHLRELIAAAVVLARWR